MKPIRVKVVILIVSIVLFTAPAQAEYTRGVQAARTTMGIATTNPSAVVNPDQMVKVAWVTPFVKFSTYERMTNEVKVLQGGQGQLLSQIGCLLAGMTRGCWTPHQSAKNLQFFTGTPVVGNLVLRQTLSYVVGQNSSHSSYSNNTSNNNGYGSYGNGQSGSQSSTTQESYVNLHTELVRIGSNGQDDILYTVPDIQAYENGTICASGSESSSQNYNGNGCGRDIFGYRTLPYSNADQHTESWSWQNSSQLLEAKSATRLAQYLATGSTALICQAIKEDQSFTAEAQAQTPVATAQADPPAK